MLALVPLQLWRMWKPAQVEHVLQLDPYGGAIFIFRGRRGDMIKALHWDGQGLVLYAKRLEKGRFVWPQASEGTLTLTAAQLSMLIEGIDWRRPVWTARRCARGGAGSRRRARSRQRYPT